MANNESKSTGDLGKPQPAEASSVPAGKPAATTSKANRGNTVGGSRSGPTELPAQFGRYRVIKKLGGGGMGTVYLVENTELEREEALKVPHFGEGDDPQLRERFLREAKSAAKLDHANLCPVWDAGVLDGTYYMTMRLLKGKLLSDYTGAAQPARKAVEIVTKLAQALEAAHGKGVIHRDLKPSNIMMVAGVGPVVMDFGLAKRFEQEDQNITKRGSMLGTPAYMPPEQVKGELEGMGPASDVYSLGVILYELLTGRLPFEGTMGMIFGQILYTEPPLPSALVPGLNPTLDGICRKAMAKASAERYPSMNAFAAALLDFLRSTSATEGAGTLEPAGEDNAAVFQGATAGPGRQPAGPSDVFQAPGVAPQARASLPQAPRTQAPSGNATIGPRSDPQPQTVTMGQRAAERKTNVAVQKPGRKKKRRAWRLLVTVCKAVSLAFCFAALVFGTLKLSVAVFRPKQPSGTIAADNSTNPSRTTANKRAGPKEQDADIMLSASTNSIESTTPDSNGLSSRAPAPPDGTPPTLGDGSTDLLKLIDPKRDAVAGEWKCDGKTLITGARPRDRLEIPVEVPAEYRLTVVAYCHAHREALHLGLVAGSRKVLAIFDGWSKTATCLHMVDGKDGVQSNPYRGPVLRDREPNVITCEVGANRISVDCNGTRVIDWTGDFNRLSIDPPWKVSDAKYLFIGSWDTHFEISKLELSPL